MPVILLALVAHAGEVQVEWPTVEALRAPASHPPDAPGLSLVSPEVVLSPDEEGVTITARWQVDLLGTGELAVDTWLAGASLQLLGATVHSPAMNPLISPARAAPGRGAGARRGPPPSRRKGVWKEQRVR